MPQYTQIEVEAALARANGQTLAAIKNAALAGTSPASRGPSRSFGNNSAVAYKNKTGHTYAHVATFSQGSLNPVVKGMAVTQANEKSRGAQASPGRCSRGRNTPRRRATQART